MNNEMDDLKTIWKGARKSVAISSLKTNKLIAMAEQKKKSAVKMHVLNILVLVITLTGISAFFIYVAKFNQLISHIGVALMVGGLVLRILVEIFSIYYSGKINMGESAMTANESFIRFYNFRKVIHGPVTITILVLYTIGFYLLTPEFSLYFNTTMMVLIDLSYIVGAVIVSRFIISAIRKEFNYLKEILKLREELTN